MRHDRFPSGVPNTADKPFLEIDLEELFSTKVLLRKDPDTGNVIVAHPKKKNGYERLELHRQYILLLTLRNVNGASISVNDLANSLWAGGLNRPSVSGPDNFKNTIYRLVGKINKKLHDAYGGKYVIVSDNGNYRLTHTG
jgi:hypothetical protein